MGKILSVVRISSIYFLIIIGALIAYGYQFPTSNLRVDIPYIQAILNPEIYPSDFYIQESLKFSPRYYYQLLISSTISLGISLPFTYFLYYFISFSSFILGLYALGSKFGKSKLASAVLVFVSLANVDGTIGFVDLFRTEPIPAIFAMGLTIWGIYFCFCKRWFLGYLFFGIACLLQFLIGLLPGMMMAVLLIVDAKKNKNFTMIVLPFLTLGLFISLVYIPMILSSSTGTELFDNREFVYIYGHIRHPHHIVLSSFNPQKWRNFIFFMTGGILCIKSTDDLSLEDKSKLLIIIFLSLFSLLVGYIFVEVYPLSLVAKLQLARTTPFAQLMVFIGITALANQYYKQKNILVTILLILASTVYNGAIILFVIATLIFANNLQLKHNKPLVVLALLSFIYFVFLYPSLSFTPDSIKQIFWKLILFMLLAFPFISEEFIRPNILRKALTYILALLSCGFLILGLSKKLPQKLLSSFQGRIKIYEIWNNSLTKLAWRFREQSSNNALILVPPSRDEFRWLSQRAVVLTFKGAPFTDAGIREWVNRMEVVLGSVTPPVSLSNVDSLYRNRSSFELVKAARQFGAEYILTKTDWHKDIDGVVFAQEGEWIIYQINQK